MNSPDQPSRVIATHSDQRSGIPQNTPLLGAVFSELSRHLGDTYSSSLLLQSAQRLIDITEGKHRQTAIRDPPARPDYFSRNVASALRSNPWTIACFEQRSLAHCDDDELTHEATERIKRICQDQHP
ncbi:hypothetical protein [Microvirga mediterraneensis]|uniref:Uncharacterized protein n=1 Tax=Microvirga mediterraneensis TaxID=2754695 RepID=A0A838BVX5_9HYPH|nr:hypothetical protein [Microvirga mediterraneensis]MBA1159015.1 hypothetical protein [Microvirga mediterraneensis]